jgi:hypothetical protein
MFIPYLWRYAYTYDGRRGGGRTLSLNGMGGSLPGGAGRIRRRRKLLA